MTAETIWRQLCFSLLSLCCRCDHLPCRIPIPRAQAEAPVDAALSRENRRLGPDAAIFPDVTLIRIRALRRHPGLAQRWWSAPMLSLRRSKISTPERQLPCTGSRHADSHHRHKSINRVRIRRLAQGRCARRARAAGAGRSGQTDAAIWFGLAVACAQLNDQANANSADDQVLVLEPRNLRALVLKGDLLDKSGDARNASASHQLAVRGPASPRIAGGTAHRPGPRRGHVQQYAEEFERRR